MNDTPRTDLELFSECSKAMPFIGGCKDGEIRPVKNFKPEVEHKGFRFFYDVVKLVKQDGSRTFIAIPSCNQSEL